MDQISTPWHEVRRALNGPQVAAELGLKPARERDKYGCVACDSSDALHVYADRSHCYSCGWSGSVIDVAARAWHVEPAEACRRLAERFGIQPDPTCHRERPTRRVEPTTDADVIRQRAEVYGNAVSLLRLGPAGSAYLRRRGLAPELAMAHGIRSIESPDAWVDLYRQLGDRHDPEAMAAAGFARDDGPPWTPWRGDIPALLIPYLSRAEQVEAVRFRRIDTGMDHRYMAPLRAGARIPWHAEAIDGPHPLHIVVAEGELDALALIQAGYDSIGLGGATPSRRLLSWLVDHVEDVDALALWTDPDQAGDRAVDRLANMLIKRYGAAWVRSRVTRWRAAADPATTLSRAAA